ncbi:hypothetical protein [Mucisphaera sp.]|uniref:hypothetical protein n=1 Tax=Mucisphaera sp. TaxID=2913024 RepID=UPI003D0E0A79
MTTNASDNLLRLLEPAVRPVQSPASPAPTSSSTFESRPFDDLLAEATQAQQPDAEAATQKTPAQNLLGALANTENASVRQLMEAAKPLGHDLKPQDQNNGQR